MSVEITMPQLSDTMNEGTILRWLKKEGDTVKRGETLAEIATDKADLEIESFHEGVVLKIFVEPNKTVKVGTLIAVVGAPGEQVTASSAPVAAAPQSAPVASAPTAPSPAATAVETPSAKAASTAVDADERIKISPLARNIAESNGVDYTLLTGTGEGGRIVRRDVETYLANRHGAPSVAAAAAPVAAPSTAATPYVAAPAHLEGLSKMRQTIAARMVESINTIPHFYVTTQVRMDAAKKIRESLKTLPAYEGITFNHLILRAVALTLKKVPAVNSSIREGSIYQPAAINIGIVTAVDGGLLIPVLKRVDELPLADIVSTANAMVKRARAGRPKPDDLVDGTFSISNMGPYAVESFTAIISPGQGGILALSSIVEEPVVVGGVVKPGLVMRATLSLDHRVTDGVVGGEFVTEFKRLLEDPILLLA